MEHAQALQRLLREERRSGYRGLENAPHEYLGAFDSLPGSAQQTLIDSIVQRDRYRMSGYRAGAWHLAMTRLLLALRNGALRTTAVPNVVQQLLDVLAFGFRAAPAALLEAFHHHRLVLMGRLNHRPSLLALLEAAQIDARSFAVCYAQGIPQPPAYRGLWHDEERHNTIAMVVGIDLVPLSNGWLVVETNPSAAQKFHGLLPYDPYNPFIAHLLEFAVENCYQRLVIMNNDSEGMDPQLARQYLESAQKCGIALKIYERASVPSTCTAFERCAEVPQFEGEGTLVVQFRSYKTSLDFLFDDKRESLRALATYRDRCADHALCLSLTSSEPILGYGNSDEPFPTVVYKLRELDYGRGVFFLKAHSLEHAQSLVAETVKRTRSIDLPTWVLRRVHTRPGVFQPYYRGPLLPERRLYIVRSHILVSTVGAKFLSAHRIVSGHSVPEQLPHGIVLDPRPYIVNRPLGGRLELLSKEEDEGVMRANLAVARALAWAASYGFLTAPQPVTPRN